MRNATLLSLLALAGAVAGILAKQADESGIDWASDLGTYPAVWILAIALIGRFAPTGAWAAGRGSVFFVAMTAAYYAWSVAVLGFPVDRWLWTWGAMAVCVVPILAAIAWWASRARGIVAGAPLAVLAGLALADGTIQALWLRLLGELPAEFPLRPVQAAADVLVALTIAVLLPVRRETRAWALALTPVMAVAARAVADAIFGMLS